MTVLAAGSFTAGTSISVIGARLTDSARTWSVMNLSGRNGAAAYARAPSASPAASAFRYPVTASDGSAAGGGALVGGGGDPAARGPLGRCG